MPRKIDIAGAIVANDDKWIYDWFDMDATSPRDVRKQMDEAYANNEDIEVHINSPGGDVYAGSEIYTGLRDYPGDVVVKIIGLAASAASVVAMAGKKVLISPTAQLMIHNTWTIAAGNSEDFKHEAKVLASHDEGIANAYMLKTGMSQKELRKLMDDTTYMSAQEAVRLKFADEVMFDGSGVIKVVAVQHPAPLSQEVLDRMRQHLKPTGKAATDAQAQAQARAQLQILKLKGETR